MYARVYDNKLYPYHISLVFNLSDDYCCRTATVYMCISIQSTISIYDEKYSDSNGCNVLNLRYNDVTVSYDKQRHGGYSNVNKQCQYCIY